MIDIITKKSWLVLSLKVPTDVELSKSRRAKYYSPSTSKEVPKKYQGKNFRYLPYPVREKHLNLSDDVLQGVYKNKRYLTDLKTKERVIANPRISGTPNTKKINSNLLYSTLNQHTRDKMVNTIKEYYTDNYNIVLRSEPEYPSFIKAYYSMPKEFGDWDCDNAVGFYNKVLQDWVNHMNFIPEDNTNYIQSNVQSELLEPNKEGTVHITFCIISKKNYHGLLRG